MRDCRMPQDASNDSGLETCWVQSLLGLLPLVGVGAGQWLLGTHFNPSWRPGGPYPHLPHRHPGPVEAQFRWRLLAALRINVPRLGLQAYPSFSLRVSCALRLPSMDVSTYIIVVWMFLCPSIAWISLMGVPVSA